MKKFKIKEFAAWHLKKYGPGVFMSDVYEYYYQELGKSSVNLSQSRFENIVARTVELNNY